MLPIILLMLGVAQASAHVTRIPARCSTRPAPVLCSIHFHYARANVLRGRMGQHPLAYRWLPEKYTARRARFLSYWQHVHARTARRYRHSLIAAPWLHGAWYADALCVHHYEGAWNDPGAPYYGGLQMDMRFQAAYGGEYLAAYGTADHWPVSDQLHAAYRAWQSRGWTPWPNTAAMCGLL